MSKYNYLFDAEEKCIKWKITQVELKTALGADKLSVILTTYYPKEITFERKGKT